MDELRFGIIGIGGMGGHHARQITRDNVPGVALAAVCDIRPERLGWARKELGEDLPGFESAEEMMDEVDLDAVIIATPHYGHPPLAVKAFERGLHVMSEKPAGVYTRQVREMNEAAAASGCVFGIMFQQRTSPVYQKLRELIREGELGELRRIEWTITSWYRTQSYYDSGGWRATWAGEGGGVLMNQCPHNVDLWQWMFGMPARVRATCFYGKHHRIEVEDEVFAAMEYENGAVGTFITSTGEAPGTNRLEVMGDRGKVALEGGGITFLRTRQPVTEHLVTCKQSFAEPESWRCQVPHNSGAAQGHNEILKDFARAIREGTELLAPGAEGIRSLELANAMLLSSWEGDRWVDVPVDADLYYERLQERIETSTFRKEAAEERPAQDLSDSF
jgi:predicted dehydrogenase